jgi:AhpC/TSA family
MAFSRLLALVAALILATCGGDPGPQRSIDEGDAAPDFTLPSAEGGTISLSSYVGAKPVLLYFSMGPG